MEEIKVKRFSSEDVYERVNWINNRLINENMFFDLPATVENTYKWCESIRTNVNRIDFSFLDSEGNYLAMGGFTGISDEHKNAEFYIMVNPLMQGRGIGQKVSRWMYNYAFSFIGLHKIFLFTNDNNVKAYSIYEKVGFSLEGILRDHKWKNGCYQNRRIYGLLRSEWKKLDWKEIIENEI